MKVKITKKQVQPERLSLYQKLFIGMGAFFATYILSLFIPFISAYTQYPLYVVRCGRLPVAASTFAAGDTYTVPGTRAYKIDVFTDRYFCTEQEAKAAWFQKYDFDPNVK